ncbi:hypothetical protein BDR05DRAFT_956817 [Suillus weaverae]|nr:hypothetical protein BDR05DRAFT_956817 [Suillus weaverae]
MTVVSYDPSWWLIINWNIVISCWTVAAGAVVVYDWGEQEIELIWGRQRWSLMTVLYLVELIVLSGTYMCNHRSERDVHILISMVWVLNTVWEVLALCLAVWIAVKHFRDLRRLCPSTGSTIGDCFRVLIKPHVLYFASFVWLSVRRPDSNPMGALILGGALHIFLGMQMFVLGPRLILSVREYHAKLVAESDAETSMTSIVFQERAHVPTSSTV